MKALVRCVIESAVFCLLPACACDSARGHDSGVMITPGFDVPPNFPRPDVPYNGPDAPNAPPFDVPNPTRDIPTAGAISGVRPGEDCRDAPTIGPGTYIGLDTTFANNDFLGGPSCSPFMNHGPDHAFAIVVPPGGRLTVLAAGDDTPGMPYDLSLYLIGDLNECKPSPQQCMCLAGADMGPANIEHVRYLNQSPNPLTIYAVVNSSGPAPEPGRTNRGRYTLIVAIE